MRTVGLLDMVGRTCNLGMDHLVDTVIGGLLALSGTALAQWFGFFSSRVERRSKHAALQRERLEKISDCVAECVEWSQQLMTATTVAAVREQRLPKQGRQAVMIAKIYFPGLVKPATDYVNELVRYQAFALTSFLPDAPPGTSIGAQMVRNPKAQDYESRQFSLRNTFDEAIAEEAKKYEPPS